MGALEVTIANGVQTIRFNRPEKKNAITHEMYKGVISAMEQSAEDDNVVLTVLTGTGDYYSSGNDFSMSAVTDPEAFVEDRTSAVEKFVAALIDYPKLVIAVVNGPAIGIAATSLALCDIIYASDKAWFQTPFTRLGLVPEGCSTLTFPHILGPAKASRLLYLNETLTASDAAACGFITQVFPHSQLTTLTSARIQEHARLPLQSLKLSKQLVRGWNRDLLHRVNQQETRVLKQRFMSEDFITAIQSFRTRKSKL